MSKVMICSLPLAIATAAFAGTPIFTNTLGDPGFMGSYVASFTTHDDGTGEALYATGNFSAVGVPGTTNIAKWDGSAWTSVGGGLQNQYSNAMVSFQGDLIVGGYFDSANSVPGTAKLARFDGTDWNSMDAQMEFFLNSVWDLTTYDGDLIVAGNYVEIGGDPTIQHIAKWDGSTYTALGTPIGGAVPLIVLDVLNADMGSGDMLFAAGRFLSIDGVPANNIAVYDGSSWSALGDGITRSSGFAQGFHMAVFDDGNGPALYVGGSFNRINGGADVVNNIAKWDGSTWSPVGDGFNSAVQELVVFDDGSGEALYALGNFVTSGANSTPYIAKWNGTEWKSVGAGADNNVLGAIVFDAGEGEALHFGGNFTMLDGLSAARTGSLLASLVCEADLTGDGTLDVFDVFAFLDLFNAGDLAADLTGDGSLDVFDVFAFLDLFNAGCP